MQLKKKQIGKKQQQKNDITLDIVNFAMWNAIITKQLIILWVNKKIMNVFNIKTHEKQGTRSQMSEPTALWRLWRNSAC